MIKQIDEFSLSKVRIFYLKDKEKWHKRTIYKKYNLQIRFIGSISPKLPFSVEPKTENMTNAQVFMFKVFLISSFSSIHLDFEETILNPQEFPLNNWIIGINLRPSLSLVNPTARINGSENHRISFEDFSVESGGSEMRLYRFKDPNDRFNFPELCWNCGIKFEMVEDYFKIEIPEQYWRIRWEISI